jgi:hypothetical protein
MSFLAAQVSAFAAQIVAASTTAFPVVVTFRGETITVKSTAVKRTRQIEAGGFEIEHDATVRIPVATVAALTGGDATPPRLGELLTVVSSQSIPVGTVLRIDSVALPSTWPEFTLGVAAQ